MENRGKVLNRTSLILSKSYICSRHTTDITIRCLLEDSAWLVLDALMLAILHGEDEDNFKLERVSPMTWDGNYMIEL